jgi:hypothetical protein
MSEQVEMTEIPVCNFCEDDATDLIPEPAYVDAKTQYGGWAYMCRQHWSQHGGTGGMLGTGNGQRLVLREEG